MKPSIVAKVGGSLFDLPDLRERLLAWVKQKGDRPILFVPGGGEAANVIRKLDEIHQLGEEKSHWLAIRMMSGNAHFLAELLGLTVVSSPSLRFAEGAEGRGQTLADCERQPLPPGPLLRNGEGGERQISVLDPLPFCETDPLLEQSWRVTSDSIAARVAIAIEADLDLLKSVDLPPGTSWQHASKAGLLDEFFPSLVENSGLEVTWVNLRASDATPRQ